MAKTVRDLVEGLVAGKLSLDAVASDFRRRSWPKRPKTTEAQAWGVADDSWPDDNSWDVVTTCSVLTAKQYAALAQAYTDAQKG